ncbi:MAG: hypothetical protein IJX99_03895 [Clostridia bacterium]|nr:hypothetical protein [Clostridia bacterium]
MSNMRTTEAQEQFEKVKAKILDAAEYSGRHYEFFNRLFPEVAEALRELGYHVFKDADVSMLVGFGGILEGDVDDISIISWRDSESGEASEMRETARESQLDMMLNRIRHAAEGGNAECEGCIGMFLEVVEDLQQLGYHVSMDDDMEKYLFVRALGAYYTVSWVDAEFGEAAQMKKTALEIQPKQVQKAISCCAKSGEVNAVDVTWYKLFPEVAEILREMGYRVNEERDEVFVISWKDAECGEAFETWKATVPPRIRKVQKEIKQCAENGEFSANFSVRLSPEVVGKLRDMGYCIDESNPRGHSISWKYVESGNAYKSFKAAVEYHFNKAREHHIRFGVECGREYAWVKCFPRAAETLLEAGYRLVDKANDALKVSWEDAERGEAQEMWKATIEVPFNGVQKRINSKARFGEIDVVFHFRLLPEVVKALQDEGYRVIEEETKYHRVSWKDAECGEALEMRRKATTNL